MNDATIALESPTTDRETKDISEAVVDAVADAKGVSTLDVRPPLYEAIDPDALDEFVTSMACSGRGTSGHIAFPYSGYEVVVSANGEVSVTETERQK